MTRSDRSASACYILLKGSLFFLICLSALSFISPTLAQRQTPTPEPTPTPTPARLIRRLRDLVVPATPTPTPTPPPLSPIRTFPIMVELPTPTPTPSMATPTPTPNNLSKTKTYVIPHILEKSGTISITQFTFDTILFATYTAGLAGTPAGPGATLDLYLYDESSAGAPLVSSTKQAVCSPCSYTFDSITRKQSIRIDDLITARGGFDKPVKVGYGVIVVQGDADNVSLSGVIANSHTSPFDLSTAGFEPIPLVSPKATRFSIPHILEKSGTINNAQFTFDTTLFAAYTAGLAGTPAGPGATLDLYLYESSAAPLVSNTKQAVCNPCSYTFDSITRKQSIRIDDLITAKGGFDKPVKAGYGVIVVQGDADNVSLQGFVINSHTSPFDLSLFGFKVIPLDAGGP